MERQVLILRIAACNIHIHGQEVVLAIDEQGNAELLLKGLPFAQLQPGSSYLYTDGAGGAKDGNGLHGVASLLYAGAVKKKRGAAGC